MKVILCLFLLISLSGFGQKRIDAQDLRLIQIGDSVERQSMALAESKRFIRIEDTLEAYEPPESVDRPGYNYHLYLLDSAKRLVCAQFSSSKSNMITTFYFVDTFLVKVSNLLVYGGSQGIIKKEYYFNSYENRWLARHFTVDAGGAYSEIQQYLLASRHMRRRVSVLK
ncbi:MAG: hypothetical protein EOO12_01575 [Chitinophagaceae bacterium]|nr:MAG: hypothetical protein EOO12_01575 [Chitinophagaceae bacterium]